MSVAKPARGLNGIKVEKSLQRNILPAIHNKVNVMSCRASWLNEGIDKSVLVDKRDTLDAVISKISGVEFFLSCITGTTSNSGKGGNVVRPAIAYFISFKKGITACTSDVFKAIHDSDLDATVATIKTSAQTKDPVMQSLKQVVKDHNSTYAMAIVDEWRSKNEMKFKTPCHLVAVDRALCFSLKNAFNNLKSDGMTVSYNMEENTNTNTNYNIEPATGIGKAINVVKNAMKNLGHALYDGEIYKRAENGQFAYVPFCSVDYYLQLLIKNPVIQDDIILHLPKLSSIISDPACKVISQLVFHYDLFEIRGGYCLKLSSRKFIKTPLKKEDLGVLSPRGFSNYHLKERSGGYFETSIKNSFPDVFQRTIFLNKFYQCLLYGQIPHKMKKLVCFGPTNSGKSAWSKVFFGLLRASKIASITKEKVFGMAMVRKLTELIFIDEWCRETLSATNVKELFQGGYFIKPVKNQLPEPTENKAPLFVCCNELPKWEEEQENIDSRIAVFPTQPMSVLHTDAPTWIEKNAMRCVAWIIREINENIHCIPEGDRFYEKEVDDLVDVKAENAAIDRESERIMALNSTDIKQITIEKQCNAVSGMTEEEETEEEDNAEHDKELEESSCSDTDCLDISSSSDANESDVDCYDISVVPKKVYRRTDMNTPMYFKDVRRVINNNMDAQGGRVKKINYVAYMNRFSRANPAILYTRPEPQLDAWLCVAGKKRDVFNARGFIKTYPTIKKKIEELRLLCNFQVPRKEARRWEIPEEHSVTAMQPIKRNVPTSSEESDEEERRIGENDYPENLIDFDSIRVEKTPARKRRKTGRVLIESDSEMEEDIVELSAEVSSSTTSSPFIEKEMWQEHLEAITFKRGNTEYLMEKKVMIKIAKLSRDTCENRSYTRKCERNNSTLTLNNKTKLPPQICDLTSISDEAADSN